MSKHEGKPLAVDRHAASASPTEPAFVARPSGAPVYHGFRVLEDVTVEGFTFGAITDFEMELCETGDAFVVAPDGSRAGLVWEVGAARDIEQVLPLELERWGVWAGLVPARNENPRRCTEQPCFCIAGLEGSLGRMEAVVFSCAAMIVEHRHFTS